MSSNIIFDAPASYISLLISVNGGQSKRKALFSTKGNPWNKDTLSVSGALKLKKSKFFSTYCHYFRKFGFENVDSSKVNMSFY